MVGKLSMTKILRLAGNINNCSSDEADDPDNHADGNIATKAVNAESDEGYHGSEEHNLRVGPASNTPKQLALTDEELLALYPLGELSSLPKRWQRGGKGHRRKKAPHYGSISTEVRKILLCNVKLAGHLDTFHRRKAEARRFTETNLCYPSSFCLNNSSFHQSGHIRRCSAEQLVLKRHKHLAQTLAKRRT
ncbi:unnamed protein product [Protopolystoma xenopodis]|uniref:Uncharacterized protein n=1 Tax=Protopolystoma xenopodis TaxID=117903 RepID=A0A3S5FGM8_9PLAT|nr:unnamed protein product [Protopolystoma xenopodis]